MRLRAAILLGVGIAGCALFRPPDRTPEIAPALADLGAAGFAFAPDVRLRNDPRAVCDGLTCADLVVENERRTILVADGAFRSPSKLRASLLEICVRYQSPRHGNVRDLAQAALVVVRDGPRAGVSDPGVLADARFAYRQLWESLPAEKRADLPDPAVVSSSPQ
jgi:hypothetical protein